MCHAGRRVHLQQTMASNIDAKVTQVNASHVAMVSQPKAVADAIITAAQAAQAVQ